MNYLCTSNKDKFNEFRELFAEAEIVLNPIWLDLDEVEADPLTVIVHKASQVPEGVLVEDTSLDIEGGAPGIHIRWNLNTLNQFITKKAVWTVLLAQRQGDTVYVYRGQVAGTIVSPKGTGFGFDPNFLPDGSTTTLGEAKPLRLNARAIAIQAFFDSHPFAEMPPITEWNGAFQKTFEKV